MSPPDPSVELEALRKGLFALDWYVSELENVLSYNENAFEAAREYFLKYISDDSFPVEERDYVLYVVNAFMNVVRSDREQKDAFERRQEEERKRQEAEKNARRTAFLLALRSVLLALVRSAPCEARKPPALRADGTVAGNARNYQKNFPSVAVL